MQGLTFSGHDAVGNATGGQKIFAVTVSYGGVETFATGEVTININGLTNLQGGVSYDGGTKTIDITIKDGKAANRQIPVTDGRHQLDCNWEPDGAV